MPSLFPWVTRSHTASAHGRSRWTEYRRLEAARPSPYPWRSLKGRQTTQLLQVRIRFAGVVQRQSQGGVIYGAMWWSDLKEGAGVYCNGDALVHEVPEV